MRSFSFGILYLVIFGLGCASGVAVHQRSAHAAANPGEWQCFGVRGGAVDDAPTANMNAYARNVAAGTVLSPEPRVVCVKH
jgi:hypothetical protein